jgi:hypothetical protein
MRTAIVWGGAASGALDLAAAYFILWHPRGTSTIAGLQGIARGLIGAAAGRGGIATAALGVAIHFLIAFTAAAVYVVAARAARVLTRQPVLCGLLYGVAVYLFMYGFVLRMRFGPVPLTPTGIVIHMFCVGLPIGLAARYAK